MIWLVLFFFNTASAQTLSMTVGKVGDHILTSREVHMSAIMEKLLYENAKPSSVTLSPLDSKTFFNEVNDAILERSLAKEANSFDIVRVDEKNLHDMESRLMKQVAHVSAWRSLEPSPNEWKAILQKKLKAKLFIKFRKESSQLPVTDAEAKRYFDDNHLKYGNLPFENFKDNIKSYLARSQVDRRLKDWYEVIKSKYKAKNFLAEL